MSDWVHCNVCIARFGKNLKFYVTSCGHVICQTCVVKSGDNNRCLKCKSTSELVEISNGMDSSIEPYFQPLSELINKLSQVYLFQQSNTSSLLRGLVSKYRLAKAEVVQRQNIEKTMKKENETLRQQLKNAKQQRFAPPSNSSANNYGNITNSTTVKRVPSYNFNHPSDFIHKPLSAWNRMSFNRPSPLIQRHLVRKTDYGNKSQDISVNTTSLRSDVSSIHTPMKKSLVSPSIPMVHLNLGSRSRYP